MAEEDGAVELSLRLRTGDDVSRAAAAAAAAAAAVAEEEAAATRRSMTIFYNGRVCAVDVTELQARTIISMASHGNSTKQPQRQFRDDHHYHQADSSSSNSGSVSTVAAQHCVAGGSSQIDPSPAASPRESLEAAVAPMMVNQAAAASGLSMKRSLQRFLEKRKTRAAAAGPLYAGDRPAARR